MKRVMIVAKAGRGSTNEAELLARAVEVLGRASIGLALEGIEILISIDEEGDDD